MADQPKRTVIVTGSTSGVGEATALQLAKQGHTVIIASRGQDKVEATAATLREESGNQNIHGLAIDLSSLDSVKAFAEELLNHHTEWAFDSLILNAGISPTSLQISPDGFEIAFATNHLGHYYLVKLLTQRLLENAKAHQRRARVVVVSSGTHDPANHNPTPTPIFDLEDWRMPTSSFPVRVYPQSKLANAIFANDLATQFDPKELTVATYDPGYIGSTGLGRGLPSAARSILDVVGKLYLYAVSYLYGSTFQIGAMERSAPFLAQLAVDEQLIEETSRYYCIDALDKCSVDAANPQYQLELRNFSDKLLAEKGFISSN